MVDVFGPGGFMPSSQPSHISVGMSLGVFDLAPVVLSEFNKTSTKHLLSL
jgi:hypothetical protein